MAKLLSVEKLPGRKGSCILHFDTGDVTAAEDFACERAMYEGRELDETELAAFITDAGRDSAMRYAARLLGVRQYSRREVDVKLTERGFSPDAREYVLDRMEKLGAIDDALYAETLARHYAGRGYGAARIRDELYRRRIDRELWDEALSVVEDPSGEIDSFIARRLRDPGDKKEIKKVTDALFRRGFSWDEIRDGMKRFGETLEDV